MRIFGREISLFSRKQATGISIDTLIERFNAVFETFSGEVVTAENAMKSPTVRAIVSSISNAISTMPVKVYVRTTEANRTRLTEEPTHPVAVLLNMPNVLQDRVTFWLDMASWLLRHGNYYAIKGQARTGPIRELTPVLPSKMKVEMNDAGNLIYTNLDGNQVYNPDELVHLRLSARNGYLGDSPVDDVREAIALEIAAEKMGASVFGNGAMPSLLFSYMEGFSDSFEDEDAERKFIAEFQTKFAKRGRFQSMFLPYGIQAEPLNLDLDKAQFIGTRQYQRTVIAGAFGVPPHMVGDMSAARFNNVEQQSLNFLSQVIRPFTRLIEAGLERSLLTRQELLEGHIIRFDFDILSRVDFKARQEGLKIRREMGIISANDWREEDGLNPLSEEDGGEMIWTRGPSGQGVDQEPTEGQEDDDEDDADDQLRPGNQAA